MKFKFFLYAFNIVLFVTFIIIFFLPAFILGFSFLIDFWMQNWYIALIFVGVLITINLLYYNNKQILTKLEAENWQGLAEDLETKIFTHKKLKYHSIRLLVDVLVLLTDFEKIKELETFVYIHKPTIYHRCAVQFATAAVLLNDSEFMDKIKEKKETAVSKDLLWISFLEAFLLLKQNNYDQAGKNFISIIEQNTDYLLKGLTAFILQTKFSQTKMIQNQDYKLKTEQTKNEIKTKISKKQWNSYIKNGETLMHIALFTKLLQETTAWIFEK